MDPTSTDHADRRSRRRSDRHPVGHRGDRAARPGGGRPHRRPGFADELVEHGFATVSTERVRHSFHDSLEHGELVGRALMVAASGVVDSAGTVVSKGGITSAEVARTALGATRARVRGQLAAGISVRDYADGTVQVVVPGNVGGRGTLVDVLSAVLRLGTPPPSAPPG